MKLISPIYLAVPIVKSARKRLRVICHPFPAQSSSSLVKARIQGKRNYRSLKSLSLDLTPLLGRSIMPRTIAKVRQAAITKKMMSVFIGVKPLGVELFCALAHD